MSALDALVEAARAEIRDLTLRERTLRADLALAQRARDTMRAERDSSIARLVAYMDANPPAPLEPVAEIPLEERIAVMVQAEAGIRERATEDVT